MAAELVKASERWDAREPSWPVPWADTVRSARLALEIECRQWERYNRPVVKT
jgi:hypothetical protein